MKDIREVKDYQIAVLGLLIALGAIVSTYILSNAVISYQKMNTQTLSVTGSASQEIKSDLAVWNLSYEVRSKDLKSGYAKINSDKKQITDFLAANSTLNFSIISIDILNSSTSFLIRLINTE